MNRKPFEVPENVGLRSVDPLKLPKLEDREPAIRNAEGVSMIANPLEARAILEDRPAKVQAAAPALERFRALLDRNHDGEILDDLERMGRFALWALKLASKLIPDHTAVGKFADNAEGVVEKVQGALGETR